MHIYVQNHIEANEYLVVFVRSCTASSVVFTLFLCLVIVVVVVVVAVRLVRGKQISAFDGAVTSRLVSWATVDVL